MDRPSSEESRGRSVRVAALTMARDEADMLPRWVDYYGGQLGVENLTVIDDNSVDGSTDNLPCPRHRLPPGPLKSSSWAIMRKTLANGFAQGLLGCYDVVICTDVDEFVVPDPARYRGLVDYLDRRSDRDVIAPVAVNILHHARLEPAFDPTQPVLSQRRLVKFAPNMCKPLIKRIPSDWSAGCHAIRAPFEIDPDLLLVHLKYYDATSLGKVSEQRRAINEHEGRGSGLSAWKLGSDELLSRLLTWVDSPDGLDVPEFDPSEVDITRVVRRISGGFFRSKGPQLAAMETSPLRALPERFRKVL